MQNHTIQKNTVGRCQKMLSDEENNRVKEFEIELKRYGLNLDELIDEMIEEKQNDPRKIGRAETIARLLAAKKNQSII